MKVTVNNGTVLIDKEHIEDIKCYSWRIDSNGYAVHSYRENGSIKRLYMHHLVIPKQRGMHVDHKNHNRSDNRRSNLRLCTPSQNIANSKINKLNKSGYKGVYKTKYNTYRAFVHINKHKVALGSFSTAEEANQVRLVAAAASYGDVI